MFDHARTSVEPWRRWYWTARWKRRRAEQLARQPLCERCLKGGIVTTATVAHHRIRHQGNETLFWDGELESVCKPCHDGEAQREEHGRLPQTLDSVGWPVGR